MKSIGLDIGTTTVCGIVINADDGKVFDAITRANDSAIKGKEEFAKTQDVEQIINICNQIVSDLRAKYDDITTIGITGQMHGILYVNLKGEAVSPLYSWQDERGNQQYKEGQTYSEYLSVLTGYQMATGYGLVTHFYNWKNDCIPKEARYLCTIADYVAMRLSGADQPLMHKSMAASIGLFDIEKGIWDEAAIAKAGIEMKYLPAVSEKETTYEEKIDEPKVSIALGDNQASFLGAVNAESNILVNIGTGSQISVFTPIYDGSVGIEYRPFIENTYLMVGASLCGGASYAMLKKFYEEVLILFGGEIPGNMYDVMNQAADRIYSQEDSLRIDTRFSGTRTNPKERGSISQIGTKNFAPDALTLGMLRGICEELYLIFEQIPEQMRESKAIIGSGNGVRRNPVLQQIVADGFQRNLAIPVFSEEASYGAALHSLYCSGRFKDIEELKGVIQTKQVKRPL